MRLPLSDQEQFCPYLLSFLRWPLIAYSKRSFYRAVNAIFGKVLSTASVEVVLHLVNAKCMPVLLYGLEACHLNKADIRLLDFCVYRLLMKLFVY